MKQAFRTCVGPISISILRCVRAILLSACFAGALPTIAADQEALNLSLFEAVERKDIEQARTLLAQGANVLAENKKGWTPLVPAAKAGNLEMVKLLVENGADVNRNSGNRLGSPVFCFAVDGGSFEVMDYLLKHGANVNGKGKDGMMALTYVASKGRLELVEYLLSKGADPEEFGPLDSKGNTFNALLAAARNGHTESFKTMIEHGQVDLERTNSAGETLLQTCAKTNQPEVIKLLLKKGAKVNAKRRDGHTALLCASHNGHVEIVKLLLAYGADPFATASHDPDDPDSKDRCGAADHALESGHLEIYELILKAQSKRIKA